VGHIRAVWQRLRQAGLTASTKKCKRGSNIVEFLSHRIGNGRMCIPESRVKALREGQGS